MKKIVIFSLILSLACISLQAKGKAGHNFRKAAIKYDVKAKNALRQQQRQMHLAYKRMADIKRHAAKLADEGKWDEIDWTEYHMLERKIAQLKTKNKIKNLVK